MNEILRFTASSGQPSQHIAVIASAARTIRAAPQQPGALSIHRRHCERSAAIQEVAIIRIDPRYFRPTEVETLLGDPTKAKEKLGWVPEITVDQLVNKMVSSDLADAKKHSLLKLRGYQVAVSVE